MKKHLLAMLLLLSSQIVFAQDPPDYWYQYFDGADTFSSAIHIEPVRDSQNIWQVGKTHKAILDSAFSRPNVLITDTSQLYPIGNRSTFYINYPLPQYVGWLYGFAFQWLQKLDMDSLHAGGIVEVSIDSGQTWQNIFNAPYVYNTFGYQTENVSALSTGEMAFTGTDSVWRDIWSCITWRDFAGGGYLTPPDTLRVRFTFQSDSLGAQREGWMIDNMTAHNTYLHPIHEVNKDEYLQVFPRLTAGNINILPSNKSTDLAMKNAELLDEVGRVVQRFTLPPNGGKIDIATHSSGWYVLRVQTSSITKGYSIFLKKTQ